jgi:UDP-N-acetylglucosamine diphosphorylase/glucosamine-1-phosphate N-acetyltransferase
MRELASIILAAGKGTRMKSEKAKVTFPLAGKSLVTRVVETSLKTNCKKIVVIVGYKKEDVVSCIPTHQELVFCEQKEQLGTGHAVMMAEEALRDFNGDVFILCGDVPLLKSETLKDMLDVHYKKEAFCTVLTMTLEDPGKYGRMVRDINGNLMSIVEFKDATDEQRKIKEINTGIYCFKSSALFEALKKIDNKNEQHEYYLTDVLGIFYKEGKRIEGIELSDLSEAAGVNSQEQLAELEQDFYTRISKHFLNSGVVIENPNTVLISEDAMIENDVTISQNVIIKGKCLIKKNTYIGPNSYIDNSSIGENANLKGFNAIINANLESNKTLNWQETLINE